MQQEIKVRKLKVKDRVVLTGLIKKFADLTDSKNLVGIVPSFDKKEDVEKDDTAEVLELAFNVLESMIKVINVDVMEWFSDLINVKREKFEDLPIDTEIIIIEQIIKQDNFKNFFLTGSRLLKEIKGLVNP